MSPPYGAHCNVIHSSLSPMLNIRASLRQTGWRKKKKRQFTSWKYFMWHPFLQMVAFGHRNSHLKCSCPRRPFTFGSLKCKAHTDADTHSSFSPLLSNLGHILCGRLGHTIPLGFEGIWRTSGLSLNLNIWITERCVNTSLCLTFRIFSSQQLNRWVLRVSFFPHHLFIPFPCAPLMVCSSRAHTSHPLQLYLLVSHSFKMYIRNELNITVMPLLSVLLSPPFSLTHSIHSTPTHSVFMSSFFPPSLLQCCHRRRFLWQQRG